MELLLQQIVNGLTVGSIYSLVALGLTLVYGTMKIPNFSHGNLYMVGAYICLFLVMAGLSYWMAMVISAIILAFLGMLVERLVFNPLKGGPEINPLIAAVALMGILEAAARGLWGAEYRRLPTVYESRLVVVGDVSVTEQRLIIIVVAVLLYLLVYVFLRRTTIGMTIEATAQDREAASLVGINVDKISMLAFALATALAAAAGSLAGPLFLVYPTMGVAVILKAFVIIVLGGMGSVHGAIIGGYILGLAESMSSFFVSTDYKDIVAFLVLVLILSLRPRGLLARGSTDEG